jgi:hypothetical protein
MGLLLKHIMWCALLSLCAACGAVSGTDIDGTMAVDEALLQTESAGLAVAAAVRGTEVVMTVGAAETRIAQESSINRQILLTVAAGSTPTPPVINAQAPASNMASDDVEAQADVMLDSGRFFLLTGVSDAINSNSDCVVNARSTFPPPVNQLYATLEAVNIAAGTLLTAEWVHEGELVVQDEWVVPFSATDTCLWFVIDRSDTDFPSGNWSVTLYADETRTQIQSPLTFVIGQ